MDVKESSKVIVVLPAFNAEKTLEKTVADLPNEIVGEIILGDDGSSDKTVFLASKLNLLTFRHERNKGYGANQKTCYQAALSRNADIIVMIHPDYQYDPKLVKYLVSFIREGYADVMLGTRIRSRKEALDGGMPLYKYLSNRLLTIIENILSGYNLTEWHTGMRAYKREVLERIDFENNADGFLFDSQILFQIIEKKFRIGEIPAPVRYFPEASSIGFLGSLHYGLGTMRVAMAFFLRRLMRKGRYFFIRFFKGK